MGNRRLCSNYRGITLGLPGKVYAGVLEKTVQLIVETSYSGGKMWFYRPGCGTLTYLYTLASILEGAWEFARALHMCFVDLEKAFSHVPWGVL